jgi:hypothetical protein
MLPAAVLIPDGLADELLVEDRGVDLGGVDERAATVHGCPDEGDRRVSGRRGGAVALTHTHAAAHGRPTALLVGRLVLLVGHRLEPGGGVPAVGAVLEHGEVVHEGVRRGTVPVLLVRRAENGVAGAHACDRAVARPHQADTLRDVQGLAHRVGVPVGAGAGGEADKGDGHPGRLLAVVDGGDVDVAGEGLRGGLGCRADGLEFHRSPSSRRGCQGLSRVLIARRSSIARYPSAASSSGRVRSKTVPGSISRLHSWAGNNGWSRCR